MYGFIMIERLEPGKPGLCKYAVWTTHNHTCSKCESMNTLRIQNQVIRAERPHPEISLLMRISQFSRFPPCVHSLSDKPTYRYHIISTSPPPPEDLEVEGERTWNANSLQHHLCPKVRNGNSGLVGRFADTWPRMEGGKWRIHRGVFLCNYYICNIPKQNMLF